MIPSYSETPPTQFPPLLWALLITVLPVNWSLMGQRLKIPITSQWSDLLAGDKTLNTQDLCGDSSHASHNNSFWRHRRQTCLVTIQEVAGAGSQNNSVWAWRGCLFTVSSLGGRLGDLCGSPLQQCQPYPWGPFGIAMPDHWIQTAPHLKWPGKLQVLPNVCLAGTKLWVDFQHWRYLRGNNLQNVPNFTKWKC